MKYAPKKRHFYRDVVIHGLTEVSALTQIYPLGVPIPQEILDQWLRKMLRAPKLSAMPRTRRLVNRFKLGADPELVFVSSQDRGHRVNAEELQLKQGRAFGADNNGRLVEVRPHPSRSALEVTASLLAAMRWMALLTPNAASLEWWCGAYLFRDGLGGHVHLGRKRPTRKQEVSALDYLAKQYDKLQVFPADEVLNRRRGDAHGQVYGVPGGPDAIRLQNHGYEYRVLPSWLDSPRLAFISLVLAKLAVYNPDLLLKTQGPGDAVLSGRKLMNFLAYYKGLDDDAKIAYALVLQQGIPRHKGGDFRPRWGLTGYDELAQDGTRVKWVPASIPASTDDTMEMFEHLVFGTPLRARVPSPTWAPTDAPHGFRCAIDMVNTNHVKGIGELVSDMAVSKAAPVELYAPDDGGLGIGQALSDSLPSGWRDRVKEAMGPTHRIYTAGLGNRLLIGPDLREGLGAKRARKLLLSGIFPIWTMQEAGAEALTKWRAQGRSPKVEPKPNLGRVLFEGVV